MKDNNSESVPQQTESQSANVLKSVNLMSVGVAGLLSWGMFVDSHSVTVSVLSGVAFYGAVAGLLILWQPGALPYVIVSRQQEVTIRRRDEQLYSLQAAQLPPPQRWTVADPVQIPSTPPAQLPAASSFVSAHAEPDDGVRREASAWLLQLYGADGSPDPKKVLMKSEKERPGRVRIAAPSAPAKQLLLDR